MYPRLAAAVLALCAASLARAAEVQFTFSGVACPAATFLDCVNQNQPRPVPYTLTYDLDAASGQLSPQFTTQNGVGYLASLQATNLAITNFAGTVGGMRVPSVPSSIGGIQLVEESLDSYELDMQGSRTFSQANGFLAPVFTEAQYRSFQDPLYSIVTTAQLGAAGGTVSFWFADGSFQWTGVGNAIAVTPVPAPGPLSLWASGLIGVILSVVRLRFLRPAHPSAGVVAIEPPSSHPPLAAAWLLLSRLAGFRTFARSRRAA